MMPESRRLLGPSVTPHFPPLFGILNPLLLLLLKMELDRM